jgi:DNA mismatch repair protein MutS
VLYFAGLKKNPQTLVTKAKKDSETPLMKQYYQIKARYPGALLLFRVGDFYETFGEDAIKAANILGIVLTKRGNGSASEIELAGFPHHSLDTYLPKLVRGGCRVAICDQLEDPKQAKGIVKRGVTELVSPGIAYTDKVLESKKNNYLAAVHLGELKTGLALLDVSTGEFAIFSGNLESIEKMLQGLRPSELIYSKAQKKNIPSQWMDQYICQTQDEWVFQHEYAEEKLLEQFGTTTLKGFGIEEKDESLIAAGAALHYASESCFDRLKHITSIRKIEDERYVWLDAFTIRNLEILHPLHPGGKALIDVLDKTVTPMGARLLSEWIVLPLKEKSAIAERLDLVDVFFQNQELRENLRLELKQVGDIGRIISRVALAKASPRDLLQLAKGLEHTGKIKQLLMDSGDELLIQLGDCINPCQTLYDKINNEIHPDAPAVFSKGGIFKQGINDSLDELNELTTNGRDKIAAIQIREVQNTGISSLKIGYNHVFGFYLEVTKTHQNKVPDTWIRKQTLTNAERYVTPELKELEEKILNAESLKLELEQNLFTEFLNQVMNYMHTVKGTSMQIAKVDCLAGFAALAVQNNYFKPEINEEFDLILKGCRHPVIEQQLPPGETYIDNDISFDKDSQRVIILTGPNMSGKSALLRQTALALLMAQMGCFVAAKEACIGIADKVYTRVGASDNISLGESTFMVEMLETASILNNIGKNSLVLLDEIGRGTATFDGVSLAWAIAEFLTGHPYKPKTLFATHYHELNELANKFSSIKNYQVAIRETENKILFLRKLKPGGSEHSFGIHVARMAGVPKTVTARAAEILSELEKDRSAVTGKETMKKIKKEEFQLTMFGINDPRLESVQKTLSELNIETLSPIDALMKLNELQKMLK